MGITPRFADLNGDSHDDIITGCYEGLPYVLWGGKKGFQKPRLILDRSGELMHTGRFWDPKTRKHSSGRGPGGRAYSALPLDWDADGDLDLVIGVDNGHFYLRRNEGTRTKPAFSSKNEPILADGAQASVPKYAMPVARDWDGDGQWDLLSGSYNGAVYWFRNRGSEGKPRFEKKRQLIGPAWGSERGERSQIDVVDFDGDGDLDLLVGDHRFKIDGDSYEAHGYIWLYRRDGGTRTTARLSEDAR